MTRGTFLRWIPPLQITSQYFTWWMNWLPLVIPARAQPRARSLSPCPCRCVHPQPLESHVLCCAELRRLRVPHSSAQGMQPHPWLIVAIITWLGAQSYWLARHTLRPSPATSPCLLPAPLLCCSLLRAWPHAGLRRLRPACLPLLTPYLSLLAQYWAYKLEFEGEDCFVRIWVASLGFFAASVWLLTQFAYSRCVRGSAGAYLESLRAFFCTRAVRGAVRSCRLTARALARCRGGRPVFTKGQFSHKVEQAEMKSKKET